MTQMIKDSATQSRNRAQMLFEKMTASLFFISFEIATNFDLRAEIYPQVCECYLRSILWPKDICAVIYFHSKHIDEANPLRGKTPEDVLARLNDILIPQRMVIDVYQKGDRLLPLQALHEIARYRFSPKDGDKFIQYKKSLIQQVV